MRLTTILSLSVLAVSTLSTLSAPSATTTPALHAADDSSVPDPNGDLATTEHSLQKRAVFVGTPKVRIKLIIALRGITQALEWAITLQMNELFTGSVDVNAELNELLSPPFSSIKYHWTDTFHPREFFTRVVGFEFLGLFHNAAVECQMAAEFGGSHTVCAIQRMAAAPKVFLGGVQQVVTSWRFFVYEY